MKTKRQTKIAELVQNENIETQDELVERLRQEGHDVTQATVSRDIRDLKLTKVTDADGRQKYSMLSSVMAQFSERLLTIFRSSVIKLDYAQNMVVIKTFEGMAMGVAACIDAMGFYDVLGSIAGDDTIFCAVRDEEAAVSVIERFKDILSSDDEEEEII